MPQVIVPHVIVFWGALLLIAAAALKWGGPPERVAAAAYLVATILTILVRSPSAQRYTHVLAGVVVVDVALLIVLLTLVVQADRWWPIFSAALQAVTVLGHLGKGLTPQLPRLAYAVMTIWSSYLIVGMLPVAVWLHQRRLKRRHISPSFWEIPIHPA